MKLNAILGFKHDNLHTYLATWLGPSFLWDFDRLS